MECSEKFYKVTGGTEPSGERLPRPELDWFTLAGQHTVLSAGHFPPLEANPLVRV